MFVFSKIYNRYNWFSLFLFDTIDTVILLTFIATDNVICFVNHVSITLKPWSTDTITRKVLICIIDKTISRSVFWSFDTINSKMPILYFRHKLAHFSADSQYVRIRYFSHFTATKADILDRYSRSRALAHPESAQDICNDVRSSVWTIRMNYVMLQASNIWLLSFISSCFCGSFGTFFSSQCTCVDFL